MLWASSTEITTYSSIWVTERLFLISEDLKTLCLLNQSWWTAYRLTLTSRPSRNLRNSLSIVTEKQRVKSLNLNKAHIGITVFIIYANVQCLHYFWESLAVGLQLYDIRRSASRLVEHVLAIIIVNQFKRRPTHLCMATVDGMSRRCLFSMNS